MKYFVALFLSVCLFLLSFSPQDGKLLLGVGSPPAAAAGITLAAHTAAGSSDGGNSVTTGSIDTTGATLLVIVVSTYSVLSNTPTDSKSNTWTGLTLQNFADGQQCRLFYVANPTVGSGHTFSFSQTNAFPSIAVAAFSGVVTSSPFDQQNGATGSSPISTGSVTPSENNELVITGIGNFTSSGGTPTIDSGFTITDSILYLGAQHMAVGLAYKVQTTAAAVNPAWTTGDSNNAATIATFKKAP